MLVLTRKLNESIIIDENIVVTIVQIKGGQVRVGIQAPKCKNIVRAELLDEPSPHAARRRRGSTR